MQAGVHFTPNLLSVAYDMLKQYSELLLVSKDTSVK